MAEQQWRCYYYSHTPLVFDTGSPWNVSIERVNNALGYTLDNTRFIAIIFNTMGNTPRATYNITGSPQWSREKMNYFLMHKFGFTINFEGMFK
eukprot:933298_1